MKQIAIHLTVDEVNLILEAIGELPYSRVYKLVEKIQHQALQQLDQNENNQKN